MSWRVFITPHAVAELTAIHDYISRDSTENANNMVSRILTAIEGLAILPHRNIYQKSSRKLRGPVYDLPVEAYIIFFRIDEQARIVNVVSIRHSARRRPRL